MVRVEAEEQEADGPTDRMNTRIQSMVSSLESPLSWVSQPEWDPHAYVVFEAPSIDDRNNDSFASQVDMHVHLQAQHNHPEVLPTDVQHANHST